ncbi:MAG TPA: hypothetical protein VGK24_10415 [Candidatus Angelobacter sp.]|jgi:hypothetical protein
MKPAGNTDRRLEFSSWQRQPQIKTAILHRIQAITSELKGLQAQMHVEFTAAGRDHRLAEILEDADGIQVFNDFKAEIDQLRRILWFYIEEAASHAANGMDQEQQANRLQRVNELMRALTPKTSPSPDSGAKPASFFERLDVVIDTYMQEKKPVAQVKAAKAGY